MDNLYLNEKIGNKKLIPLLNENNFLENEILNKNQENLKYIRKEILQKDEFVDNPCFDFNSFEYLDENISYGNNKILILYKIFV